MDERYLKMKISEVSIIPEGLTNIYKDHWWTTDGENIFFYKGFGSPQCNKDKEIAQQIADVRKHQLIFIPIVYVPHNCSDY